MAEGEHKGVAIMAYVTPDEAGRLAVPGGEAPEDLHVTLDYLAEPAAEIGPGLRELFVRLVRPYFSGNRMPLTANAFARAEFNFGNPPDHDMPPCSLLLVQSESILIAHNIIQHAVNITPGIHSANTFPIWLPHISLGYNIDIKQIDESKLGPVTFDRIAVSWGGELQYI